MILISGRSQQAPCGVWDYSENLCRELNATGCATQLECAADWSATGTIRNIARALGQRGLMHLQFPSQAFERRLGPYFMLLGARRAVRVVTMHEFSRKSRVGKALCFFLLAPADLVIFTSEEERAAAESAYPRFRDKFVVIPIPSNIPAGPIAGERTTDIIYFGLIREGKGIEQFLDVAEQLSARALRIRLVGQAPTPLPKPCADILARARSLGVEVRLDASTEEAAGELASARIALLPFPDGISERRGSALAAMLNGALVLSTSPERNREAFAPISITVDEPSGLAAATLSALENLDAHAGRIERAREYAAQRSWSAVARAHLDRYASLRGSNLVQ